MSELGRHKQKIDKNLSRHCAKRMSKWPMHAPSVMPSSATPWTRADRMMSKWPMCVCSVVPDSATSWTGANKCMKNHITS